MEAKTPNSNAPAALRCPTCGGLDVVSSLPRHLWDEVMRAWGRLPRQCRTCGRRFHVREPRRTPPAGQAE